MELVLKVAEFRSFTKAAEALKIPQPSLSQSILSLERELGTQLFNRTSNPISLTHAGKIYASKAKIIFDAINDLKNDISEISG
ncbi:LysR family transcriptional regulator, partial [uncultured Campylobacter sp.]|uniref:LysR family transcriptional regulator n=1 Tax=uncultured Campylobacter sp. TaxID=218934 RepID=UPI0026091EBD